ncbi:efflux RND transporter periplasmic adaptor subunit [Tianweitania sp.]|uniref:efflux RND transporter periplasmic adaptor subunit n=1 Tax=Tianweitania sp. TaxID=2021634 RepID=UPI00289B7E45|nr:efflux RND transporter periplasmic adaptor subunit [Tianweitania sp.]
MRLASPSHILVAASLVALAGCSQEQASPAAGPGGPGGAVEVGYVVTHPQSVERSTSISGRVVAHSTAEIRPQVDGIVKTIAFQEGRAVEAGATLFELQDQKFRAAYDAAAAALAKAQASEAGAQSTFDRSDRLAKSSTVSQQVLDEARTALLQATADVEVAKADLETAKINLDNTVIKAPIAGIIGTADVSVGSLVTANQTDALATIRTIDPVNVDLVDTSANLLRLRQDVEAGRLGRNGTGAPTVTLTLENGQTYEQKGEISLATVNVSQTPGTFTLRSTFANPQRVLLPGMFVRATVDVGSMPNAYLIPQRAVQRDATAKPVVYVVSADGKAEQRAIVTNGNKNNDWIVTEGLNDGDRLIVDGFQKISAGAAVAPVEAKVDKNGVVGQSLAPSTATQAPAVVGGEPAK